MANATNNKSVIEALSKVKESPDICSLILGISKENEGV